jgi:hypothetical protein
VKNTRDNKAKTEPAPHRVRLPGFLVEQEIGLGDVIKRATSAIGIRPCAGCEKRAAALNRWLTFSR